MALSLYQLRFTYLYIRFSSNQQMSGLATCKLMYAKGLNPRKSFPHTKIDKRKQSKLLVSNLMAIPKKAYSHTNT